MSTTIEEMKSDYDWKEAWEFAQADMDDVDEILASDDGCNEGPNWICVAKLKNGTFLVLRAGCDYTGWDCQAGGNSEIHYSLEQAFSVLTLNQEELARLAGDMQNLGLN